MIFDLEIVEINVGEFDMRNQPFVFRVGHCGVMMSGGKWPAMELVYNGEGECDVEMVAVTWVSMQ
jgi:hypothetical protein